MKDGSITEQGCHRELSKAGGDYSQMLTYDHARTARKQSSTDDSEVTTVDEDLPSGLYT